MAPSAGVVWSVIRAGYLSPLMATFDQLSAEQRAIIELVLKQGQSYDQLGDMLGLPTSRVRELAREALVRLSPVSAAAVDDDWRDQLADYLLNQQNGPEATATRGHLRRSEAARGWARSVLDSLEQLYDDGERCRTIPERRGAAERTRPSRSAEKRAKRESEGAAPAPARAALARGAQRGPPAAAARPAARWRAGRCCRGARRGRSALLTGDDDDDGRGSRERRDQPAQIVGQLVLRPDGRHAGTNTAGVGRDRRARRPAPADRPGAAAAQQGPRGLRGVAVQLA